MARHKITDFPSQEVVDGFIAGIQYVNDSALAVIGRGADWVIIDDADDADDADDSESAYCQIDWQEDLGHES